MRRALAGAVVAIAMFSAADRAVAGEFAVATCQADTLNYSTQAFEDFATRGMKIRRACNPYGSGQRGLITSNVTRPGRVPRGAVSLVMIEAPYGTQFTRFRWAGTLRRRDCRYALQIWADAGDAMRIPIKNVRANEHCPRPTRAQAAAYLSRTFNVSGATRIVQRVICMGDQERRTCSSRGRNYVRTNQAEVVIADVSAPTATILGDTPLARGEWVRGIQPLNYDASDNVGVRMAKAIAGGREAGFEARPCTFAVAERKFAASVPCPNGPGQIKVNTTVFAEGTQPLLVQTLDTAGNVADSAPTTARIDNSPPGRIEASVEGGDAWRNRNEFAVGWANATEPDRAPIAAAAYKLCPLAGGCVRGEQLGANIARLGISLPAPGQWTLSLWRRDAAGNETEDAASVPVNLRFDPEPPRLAFEPLANEDPTLVRVSVTDDVSGVANGAVEISASGSGTWQTLPTQREGGRLLARIDDASLPAGAYQLRARAVDQAGNEASTDRLADGRSMALTLPLRIVSEMRAGFERKRIIRSHRGPRVVRRRVIEIVPATRVRSGGKAPVAGRLINPDGEGIAGAEVRVYSSSSVSPEQLIAVLQTGRDGRYRYKAAGSTSRKLRFEFAGSPLVLPSQRTISMSVPARTSIRVDRRRVLNGQAVTFSGQLRTQPTPAEGKLVELQARLSDRWQTFRTARTDAAGRWAIRYRFKRTRGVQRFRFRARLPREAAYPFAAGGSRSLTVQVRGVS